MQITLKHASATRIAVISDVHGEHDLFRNAIQAIERPDEVDLYVLGDIIDRGPDSKGCLALARELANGDHGFRSVTILPGNHEQMMVHGIRRELGIPDAIDPGMARVYAQSWAVNGGANVMAEFDFDFRAILDAVPAQVIDRIDGRSPAWERNGDILLIHAGVAPGADEAWFSLKNHHSPHMDGPLWIRDKFLKAPAGHKAPDGSEVTVIHGHTRLRRGSPEALLEAISFAADNHGRVCVDATSSGYLPLLEVEGNVATVRIIGPEGPVVISAIEP